jgi:putative ABC transport system permease protein
MKFLRKIKNLFGRKKLEAEMAEEIRLHLELQAELNRQSGLNPDEARYVALRQFGNVSSIQERAREQRGWLWLDQGRQDLRYAIRQLRRSPGFACTTLATIAIGIGANVAIFSFLNATLLKPPSYPDAERIVKLFEIDPRGGWTSTSESTYLDWATQNTVFENITAEFFSAVALRGPEASVQLLEKRVAANFFKVFRVTPVLGRTFVDGEDQPGRDNVAVLSHKLWASNFGADPGVVGRTIILNGKPNTIIGVMPSGGVLDRQGIEIFRPLAFSTTDTTRDRRWLSVYGMLKPGITFEQGLAEMEAIGRRVSEDYPASNKGWGVTFISYARSLGRADLTQSLYVLMAAVGMVMLVACANLANLTLARGMSRAREVATRVALGAGRWRLIRQFLTESILLSIGGGVLGLVVGYGGMTLLKSAPPGGYLPTQNSVTVDGHVLLFAMGLSLATGIVFGLFPALKGSRLNLTRTFNDGSAGSGASRRVCGIHGALVVAEIALAFVLLGSGGLLMRSFLRMQKVDIGFDSTNLAETYLPFSRGFSSPKEFNLYLHQITDRIAAVPGVQNVALTSTPPLTFHGWGLGMPFLIAGRNQADPAQAPSCGFKVITPSYFRTLGIKLIGGRFLGDQDTNGTLPVTVISESMAKKYFPDTNPVGEHLLIHELDFRSGTPGREISVEIVGVAGNERNDGPHTENSAGIYMSSGQSPLAWQFLVVRGAIDPAVLDKSLRRALREVDSDQVMEGLFTFEKLQSDYFATDRRRFWFFAIFAGIALLLAALGIYGLISYSVVQRTREIGIRNALGANVANILGLVLGGGGKLVGLGLGIGFAASLGLFRFLDSMLFNIGRYDPATLLAVTAIFVVTALLACWLPARRATKVDPVIALRAE